MNERIALLASRCYKTGPLGRDGWPEYTEFDTQKFAKLIVKECAEFVQFYYKDHACEVIAQDMKTHFGVEE
jgi:hypothetical protein